jgi:hypothetical protein
VPSTPVFARPLFLISSDCINVICVADVPPSGLQRRAQAEMVGKDMLPTWAGEASLPYVSPVTSQKSSVLLRLRALVSYSPFSVLRAHSVLSGLPHRVLSHSIWIHYHRKHLTRPLFTFTSSDCYCPKRAITYDPGL